MTLESQVCSLELAKRLKELGVPQKSFAFWINVDSEFPELHYKGLCTGGISAYLASELGELLPANVDYQNITYTPETTFLGGLKKWRVRYLDLPRSNRLWSEDANTECNARAKMLIHLLENHLISVEELGK